MFRTILDLIFPPRCVECMAYTPRGDALCGACFGAIKINSNLFCLVCRARLPGTMKICHFGAPILGAAANYGSKPVRSLVHALKFQGVKDAAKALGAILSTYIVASGVPLEKVYIVPVPLGKRRRRMRGYNQAELIADAVGDTLGLPIELGLLRRTRETRPQTELTAAERRNNIRNCFEAAADAAGRKILLLDDVATSGATLLAAAESLRRAGAKNIITITAAKA